MQMNMQFGAPPPPHDSTRTFSGFSSVNQPHPPWGSDRGVGLSALSSLSTPAAFHSSHPAT